MATEDITRSIDSKKSSLSKMSERLHDQLDKFGNVEALLSCAEKSLWEKGEDAESARRVICVAREILTNIRNQVDVAALEASCIHG